ncbi:hypothetical protein F5Y15DRAFT_373026 [Xylariaceae sp. FL0016]|nr:hypothetical protein F5Y15DRAFT_373026 [Xylariaceae sp. FL0016]
MGKHMGEPAERSYPSFMMQRIPESQWKEGWPQGSTEWSPQLGPSSASGIDTDDEVFAELNKRAAEADEANDARSELSYLTDSDAPPAGEEEIDEDAQMDYEQGGEEDEGGEEEEEGLRTLGDALETARVHNEDVQNGALGDTIRMTAKVVHFLTKLSARGVDIEDTSGIIRMMEEWETESVSLEATEEAADTVLGDLKALPFDSFLSLSKKARQYLDELQDKGVVFD